MKKYLSAFGCLHTLNVCLTTSNPKISVIGQQSPSTTNVEFFLQISTEQYSVYEQLIGVLNPKNTKVVQFDTLLKRTLLSKAQFLLSETPIHRGVLGEISGGTKPHISSVC